MIFNHNVEILLNEDCSKKCVCLDEGQIHIDTLSANFIILILLNLAI